MTSLPRHGGGVAFEASLAHRQLVVVGYASRSGHG
jgi:hypothetical protein